MSYFARELGELFVYVAYIGIGGAGKSTNVRALHDLTPPAGRGRILSMYQADHGFMQDAWYFMHPSARIRGVPVRVNVWWRGGHHDDRNAEEYFLGGALDGAVIVVDSDRQQLEANQAYVEEVSNLVPDGLWGYTALQYNKRDLASAVPVDELEGALNPRKIAAFEAVAARGLGVAESLSAVTSRIVRELERVS